MSLDAGLRVILVPPSIPWWQVRGPILVTPWTEEELDQPYVAACMAYPAQQGPPLNCAQPPQEGGSKYSVP